MFLKNSNKFKKQKMKFDSIQFCTFCNICLSARLDDLHLQNDFNKYIKSTASILTSIILTSSCLKNKNQNINMHSTEINISYL